MIDMSSAAVSARLREFSELAELRIGVPAVDMSSRAVSQRLRDFAELSRFCAELVQIGKRAGLSR